MAISKVNQTVNLWAMKKVLSMAQDQMAQVLQTGAAQANASMEPHKGTLIDVRV